MPAAAAITRSQAEQNEEEVEFDELPSVIKFKKNKTGDQLDEECPPELKNLDDTIKKIHSDGNYEIKNSKDCEEEEEDDAQNTIQQEHEMMKTMMIHMQEKMLEMQRHLEEKNNQIKDLTQKMNQKRKVKVMKKVKRKTSTAKEDKKTKIKSRE